MQQKINQNQILMLMNQIVGIKIIKNKKNKNQKVMINGIIKIVKILMQVVVGINEKLKNIFDLCAKLYKKFINLYI